MSPIRVQGLTKLYPNGRGIRNVSFEVAEGEVFGCLGPNAAGKTTMIRNLVGFLRPDEGDCRIGGRDCWTEQPAVQRELGYVPGEIAFVDGLTGIQFLTLIAGMRRMTGRRRMEELLHRLELEPAPPIRTMSKGQRQKPAIVSACMHDPTVMIFDEPTAGLDPIMQTLLWEFILEEKRRGKTIFLSSHNFAEVERTCDRAAIRMLILVHVIVLALRLVARYVDRGSMALLLATPIGRTRLALTQAAYMAVSLGVMMSLITATGLAAAEWTRPGELDQRAFLVLNLSAWMEPTAIVRGSANLLLNNALLVSLTVVFTMAGLRAFRTKDLPI